MASACLLRLDAISILGEGDSWAMESPDKFLAEIREAFRPFRKR
jgi:hypothetical protein